MRVKHKVVEVTPLTIQKIPDICIKRASKSEQGINTSFEVNKFEKEFKSENVFQNAKTEPAENNTIKIETTDDIPRHVKLNIKTIEKDIKTFVNDMRVVKDIKTIAKYIETIEKDIKTFEKDMRDEKDIKTTEKDMRDEKDIKTIEKDMRDEKDIKNVEKDMRDEKDIKTIEKDMRDKKDIETLEEDIRTIKKEMRDEKGKRNVTLGISSVRHKSQVWEHFDKDPKNPERTICKVCGKGGFNYRNHNTGAMLKHIKEGEENMRKT